MPRRLSQDRKWLIQKAFPRILRFTIHITGVVLLKHTFVVLLVGSDPKMRMLISGLGRGRIHCNGPADRGSRSRLDAKNPRGAGAAQEIDDLRTPTAKE